MLLVTGKAKNIIGKVKNLAISEKKLVGIVVLLSGIGRQLRPFYNKLYGLYLMEKRILKG